MANGYRLYICSTNNKAELFLQLHSFITHYSQITASLKYRIPFYSLGKRPVCYINPQKSGGVEIVFWGALKMKNNTQRMLDYKKRKMMAGITYRSVAEINFEVLDAVILESLEL